jgi:glycosyltransferase involved in cell wall biosynthesis
MVEISAVIITFNEEEKIEKCLHSLKSIANEIVVVDSFSTDKTKELCLKNGVTFYEHPFKSYIDQKNYAASLAKNNYILSIDADEVLSDELTEEIKKVKQDFTADGYEFNRLSNYCGKWIHHSGWYPDRKLRLWDRRKGKWGGENPHDKFEMQSGSSIKFLKGNLYHYLFTSNTSHIAQANKFSTLGAKKCQREKTGNQT